jgi:hypothetical protein
MFRNIGINIKGDITDYIDKLLRERTAIRESELAQLIQKTIDTLYDEDLYVTQKRWEDVILPLIKELEGLLEK